MREVTPAKRRAPVLTVVALTGLDRTVEDIAPHSCTLRPAQLCAEELVDADRRKDEFLAMLGHELRSPLGAIRNSVVFCRASKSRLPRNAEHKPSSIDRFAA